VFVSLQLKEWITYSAILIVTLFLFWLTVPKNNYQPKGIALPMTQTMSNQITSSPNWSSHGRPTQWINVEYHVKKDSPEARKLVIQKALSLAKATGAHSVIMQPLFFADTTAESPMLSVLIGHGVAIK
jgi:hypothetical protein